MAAATPRGSVEERERLARDFVRLCAIASPSLSERAVADVVRHELTGAFPNIRTPSE